MPAALAYRPASDPAVRATMIGGSDAAKVVEVSKWGTGLDVWSEKLGLVERTFHSEAAEWGTLLEPVVLREYAVRQGVRVGALHPRTGRPVVYTPRGAERRATGSLADELVHWLGTLRHPDHDFIGCHVDGWELSSSDQVTDPIEAKTSSVFRAKEWGEPGTDQSPDEYVIQDQHISLVVGALRGGQHFAPPVRTPVLIGGQAWKVFEVAPHHGLQARLVDLYVEFWKNHVERREPPTPRAHELGAEALKRLFPQDGSGERIVSVMDPLHKLVMELRVARRVAKDTYETQLGIENRIKLAMGTTSKLIGNGWSITWKNDRDRLEIDWSAAFQELANLAQLNGVPTHETRGIVSKYTTPRRGARRFLPKGDLFKEK